MGILTASSEAKNLLNTSVFSIAVLAMVVDRIKAERISWVMRKRSGQ